MIPPPLNPGDPLYAAWLNQLRDAVLAEIVGDGDVVVRRAGTRLTVGLARRIPGVQASYLAKITALGGSAGEYKASQVLPDGSAPSNPLVWDGEEGNLAPLTLLPGGCGPAINKVVRVTLHNGRWYFENHQPFYAIITGNTAFDNRFKYAWSEVRWNGDDVETFTGGRSGTTSSGYALNIWETKYTSQYKAGIDTQLAPYSDGTFQLMPVGGAGSDTTHKYNVPVLMYEILDVNGDRTYLFEAPNSHDGECE